MLPLRAGHGVRLLVSGQEFFPALVHAMDGARYEIRLETYIFHLDRSGEQVLQALERAARRGVQVFLVMDGIGTDVSAWDSRLTAAGIRWVHYAPLGPLGWLIPERWRRLHRKLCVVDRELGFCGGINILDDFYELHHGWQQTPRLDFAVQVRGPLVEQVWTVMESFWRRLHALHEFAHGPSLVAPLAPAGNSAEKLPSSLPAGAGVNAALVLRDNVLHRTQIERTYRQAIARAQSEVLLANAYFLPGAKLRRALLHAAQRGVRVRLLLSGRYEFFLQQHAVRPFYIELLDAGVEILEYQYAYLHAKVAVIDGHWATVGSSNLDPLSLLLAREANVVVDDTAFAGQLRQHLLNAMQRHGTPVALERQAARHWGLRLQDAMAYVLLRLSLLLVGRNY